MCQLKLISKRNSEIENDRQVNLGGKEFNLLDKPYYVVESSEDNLVSYTFHYMDKEEEQRKSSNDYFSLAYGMFTGRIYTFIVKSSRESRIPNEKWALFHRTILRIDFDTELAKSNLKLGFNVIKKLYFSRYQVIK